MDGLNTGIPRDARGSSSGSSHVLPLELGEGGNCTPSEP
jgi:hypothetical protein